MKSLWISLLCFSSIFCENVDSYDNPSFTNLTNANVSEVMSAKYSVIDFYAEWCHPCRRFAPIFNEVAKQMHNQFKFYKVNIDAEKAITKKFNVSSVPVTIYLKEGVEVSREVGYMSKEAFEKKIQKSFSEIK